MGFKIAIKSFFAIVAFFVLHSHIGYVAFYTAIFVFSASKIIDCSDITESEWKYRKENKNTSAYRNDIIKKIRTNARIIIGCIGTAASVFMAGLSLVWLLPFELPFALNEGWLLAGYTTVLLIDIICCFKSKNVECPKCVESECKFDSLESTESGVETY